MSLLKRIVASPAFLSAAGSVAANYLRLVWYSSRRTLEPADFYEIFETPAIVAIISRHRDGELNARAAEKLGIGTIRGSGSHSGDFHRKGGATAFTAMLQALTEEYNVALTADVPKVSRVAGLGIVKLAQYSGRPIYPIAIASSRRIELKNWDRTAINLPFGRIAMVGGEPIRVARDCDDATLEAKRVAVEREMNRVTARAYAIVDRTGNTPP